MTKRAFLVCALLPVLTVASRSYGMPVLHASDVDTDALYTLDHSTAAATLVGPFSNDVNRITELAYDPVNDILYGTDPISSNLYRIDPNTAAEVLIGSMDGVFMNDLAFDVSTGTLYGAGVLDLLYTIDTSTGQTTPVGPTGFTNVSALAVHPVTHVLYGVAGLGTTRTLITIDKNTAVGTQVASTVRVVSLDFHMDTHVLFGADGRRFGASPLYTIDIDTGAAVQIGDTGLNVKGMAFIPEPASVLLLGLGAIPLVIRRRRTIR